MKRWSKRTRLPRRGVAFEAFAGQSENLTREVNGVRSGRQSHSQQGKDAYSFQLSTVKANFTPPRYALLELE